MDDFNRSRAGSIPVGRADMAVDAGLRSFMLGVYNKLALGLLLSAALAYVTGEIPAVQRLLFALTPQGAVTYTGLGWVVALAPLAILLAAGFIMKNVTARNAGIIYWTIVALIGASLGTVVILYTGVSIFTTFLITASSFGVLSLIGYTTKKNLSAMGSFLIMGVWGLLIASIVNIFVGSGVLALMISGVGVLIFAGLIAYDTQHLKMIYYQLGGDRERIGVATNFGALNLYLDFINLFRFLLMFLGARR
jgi:FtsH-binding integral membrane protein